MFGISMWEVVLIMVVALIVLGPKQLLEAARVAGKMYRELVRITSEIRSGIDLDALTSSAEPKTRSSPISDATVSEKKEPDMSAVANERTGADFYADLLEESKEEDKPAEGEKVGEQAKKPGEDKSEPKDQKTEKTKSD